MSRPASTYRAARRNAARGRVWRGIEPYKTPRVWRTPGIDGLRCAPKYRAPNEPVRFKTPRSSKTYPYFSKTKG